jgi:hypothetical protein
MAVPFKAALFGARFMCRARPVVVAVPITACQQLRNAQRVAGAVVVVRRGECMFAYKAQMAADAGAAALVVVDLDGGGGRLTAMPAPAPGMGPRMADLDALAACMVSRPSGELLLQELERAASSSLLVQFGSALEPENDVCLPVRQAALSQRPVSAPGRSQDPLPLLSPDRHTQDPPHADGEWQGSATVAQITLDGASVLPEAEGRAGTVQAQEQRPSGQEQDWEADGEEEEEEEEAGGIEAADAFVRAWRRRSQYAPLG